MNPRKQVLDHGFVELLVGDMETPSDLTVVNAARVSFSKSSDAITESDKKLIAYLSKNNHWTPFAHPRLSFHLPLTDLELMHFACSVQDKGFRINYEKSYDSQDYLLRFVDVSGSLYSWIQGMRFLPDILANTILNLIVAKFPVVSEAFSLSKSTGQVSTMLAQTNYNYASNLRPISFRIKAPISIRTQFYKHKMGFVENEVSRRYVDFLPEYYKPDACGGFRGRPPKSMKQGSSDEVIEVQQVPWNVEPQSPNTFYHPYKYPTSFCIEAYDQLIKQGVAPEQARFVLPQGCYTEWWWSGTLEAFARFYKLRSDPHAQWEIRQYAEAIADLIRQQYPNQTLI